MHNWYQILGVNKDATSQVMKRAYRDKALSEHPDKGGNAERMALLTTAYQTLSDPTERRNFDQIWHIYNSSYDVDIVVPPSGYLPTAGIAFSVSFRKQHAEFVKQFSSSWQGVQNRPSSYLKDFHSDLYPCAGNVVNDVFSCIRAKGDTESQLDVELILTPEKAVEYFSNFLRAHYGRNSLRDLAKAYYRKIKQLETSSQQVGSEFQFYCGIYEILLVAVKQKIPSAKILFSLCKITEYAKHNAEERMSFMAPLFQSKHFRNLFLQALHYYWLSEESVLDESYAKVFNGQAETTILIERLKSQLSNNRSDAKKCTRVAKALRQVHLLLKLETLLNESADVTSADYHREKSFHLLDWMPALIGFAEEEVVVNTLLQIAITLQRTAALEQNHVLCMADEKLAAQIYVLALGIGHRATPDVELYACLHGVKCLLSCHYTGPEFQEILEALQLRALWLADLFPIFQTAQSNADFMAQDEKILDVMRQLLHALVDKISGEEAAEKGVTDHSHDRVFYQAFEACLKNWYDEKHNPEIEKTFRQRVMQELLVSKQWTNDDIDNNLNAPWFTSNLDEHGWTCPESSILRAAKKANIPTYKTVHGVQLNFKTGEITFILDHCEDSEKDYNRLLTFFDLGELFRGCITSAIFSLDPVIDPNMPYHPFNEMYFAPSTLYHSQLLHTMFLTDYFLKFLTVGQEVQLREPFECRSLAKFMSNLPDHLKKVIVDFHTSQHKESLHRFWIESDEVNLAVDDEGLSKDGDVLFALGNIRMIVKKKKMKRNTEGKLVDTESEDEGWDCYILTEAQKRELYKGIRIIPNSLIILQESWELLFWEDHKATYRFTLGKDKQQDLINLSQCQRDSQEKVKTDNTESLRQIYRIVLKAAEKTGMPHHYSPEFIFAQEFTKYYDEFAVYFPEFGRLRELGKAIALVKVMAAQREANQEEIQLITKRLQYRQAGEECPGDERDYWIRIRQKLTELFQENVKKQFDEWHSKFSKEKLREKRQESINDYKRQLGPLKFTESSPTVKAICDKCYDAFRSDYINEHGYFQWYWSVQSRVYREVIKPEIPRIISRLEAQKKESGHEQLSKIFEDELSGRGASRLIDKCLEGDDEPLLDALVDYDRKQVAKQIQKVFSENTTDTLDKALNHSYNSSSFYIRLIAQCETEKALKEHEQVLGERRKQREGLEKSFTNLGFGSNTEEINLEHTCSWVPASFWHGVERGHSRAVYGGVSLMGRMQPFVNPKQNAAFCRQTTEEGKCVQLNRVAGNTFSYFFGKDIIKFLFSGSGMEIKTNYYLKTPRGIRYHDCVAVYKDKNGKEKIWKAWECKIGNSDYLPRQKDIDDYCFKEGIIDQPVELVWVPSLVPEDFKEIIVQRTFETVDSIEEIEPRKVQKSSKRRGK